MADDVAELGLQIDSTSVKDASAELRNFEAVAKRTGETAEQVRDRFKRVEDQNRKLAESQRLVGTETRRASEEMERASRLASAYGSALGNIQRQIFAMAAGLGLLGQALSAAGGPWLLLAVAIKVVVDALNQVREIAKEAGQKAMDLKNLSEAVRLSINELRGLKQIAGQFDVGGDQLESWLQRASFAIQNARQGTGQLIESLNKISPVFAEQMQASTSMAQALDILANAAKQAKAQGQDVSLFWRDVFGRGSGRADAVFNATQLAGGIEAVGKKMSQYGGAAEDEINRRATLSRAIEIENGKRKSLEATLASSSTVLRLELDALKAQNSVLERSLEIKTSLVKAYQDANGQSASAVTAINAERAALEDLNTAGQTRVAIMQRMRAGQRGVGPQSGAQSVDESGFGGFSPFGTSQRGANGAGSEKASQETVKQMENAQLATVQAFNAMTRWMTVLGGAATVQEQTALSLAKLNKEFANNEHGLTTGTEKLRERAEASLKLNEATQLLALRMGVLGQTASVENTLTQKMLERQKAQEQGASFTDREIANIDRVNKANANGTMAMQGQIDSMKIEQQVMDLSIGKSTELRMVREKELESQRLGQSVSAETTAAWQKQAAAAGEVAEALEKQKIASQIRFDRNTALLSPQDVQIATQLKGLYPDVATALNSTEAAQIRFNNSIKEARQAAESFATSFVDGLLSGKSAAEALKSSLDNLAKVAANAAIKNLLEGNFGMAAIDAAVAIGAKLSAGLFDDSAEKDLKKAQDAWHSMDKQMLEFVDTANTQTVSAFRQMRDAAEDLWMAAVKAGDAASAARIANEYVRRGIEIADKFAHPNIGMSDDVKRISDLQDEAHKFIDELNRMGFVWADQAAIMRGVAEQVDEIKKGITAGLQAENNDANGKSFLNEFTDLIKRFDQLKREANITGVDSSLIDRWFKVQAQKIVDGAQLTGDAFNELSSIFPQLTDVIKESTTSVEEMARAQAELQAQFDQAAKSIVNYVSDLRTGTQTALTPVGRLSAAQSAYDATRVLAQGGNTDALNRVTRDFENLRLAAQSMFGSGIEYQNILNTGINQLLALPAVTQSTDPVVQALLDVQTKIQSSITAINATTSAVGGTTSAVGGTTTAVNTTGNAGGKTTAQLLVDSAAKLDTSITKFGDIINQLSSAVNQLVSANSILSQLQSLNNTSASYLSIIKEQYTSTGLGIFGIIDFTQSVSSNGILTALNKIVYNTAATVYNTGLAVDASRNPQRKAAFADGGVAPAFSDFIYGEHHPSGPFYGRAGANPVSITPNVPANDNYMMVSILAQILDEMKRLQEIVSGSSSHVARAVVESGEDQVSAVVDQTSRLERVERQKMRGAA